MPWQTPALRDVRSLVRDAVNASLPGADASVPNSVLRVMTDNQGALCHLTLQYVDWLALQLLPDTSETEWLDRHGQIWLVNADGSKGRKLATLSSGTASFQSLIDGVVVPQGTVLQSGVNLPAGFDSPNNVVMFETLEDITCYMAAPSIANIRALDGGAFGNLDPGTGLTIAPYIANMTDMATVISLAGGTDTETDDELRARILLRIQQPPMGGDVEDYVQWALQVPGVTRAWAVSEMGIGTITVRFMMDDLRADNNGFPNATDVATVQAYIDSKRPVTTKDCFVLSPIQTPIDITITNLVPRTDETYAEIEASVQAMLFKMAAPGQTIYAAWINYAIMNAASVVSYDLSTISDYVMASAGNMASLGTIYYEPVYGIPASAPHSRPPSGSNPP
jgi:uncharacterized phage protein gp47/JayE